MMAQAAPMAVCLYRILMSRQMRKTSSSRYSQTEPRSRWKSPRDGRMTVTAAGMAAIIVKRGGQGKWREEFVGCSGVGCADVGRPGRAPRHPLVDRPHPPGDEVPSVGPLHERPARPP